MFYWTVLIFAYWITMIALGGYAAYVSWMYTSKARNVVLVILACFAILIFCTYMCIRISGI